MPDKGLARVTGVSAKGRPSSVVYLLHRFPLHTDTFIRREIEALKVQGTDVSVISVWKPGLQETSEQLLEAWSGCTTYLLPGPPHRIAAALTRVAVKSPVAFLKTFLLALRTSKPGLKGTLYQTTYFLEAMLACAVIDPRRTTHLHNHIGDQSGTVTMLASNYSGVGYSISFHGWPVFFDAYNSRIKEKVLRSRFTRSISHFCRSQLMMFAGKTDHQDFEVVHCGLDLEKYRFRLPLERCAIIFCAARLSAEKGLSFLLAAIQILRQNGCDVKLRLAGGGPLLAELQSEARSRGIAENVEFLGYLTEQGVISALTESDLFVLSSFVEGVPVSAMEAMAIGVPVIATNVGGTSELIVPGVNGILVPPADAEAIANAVAELVADPEKRKQFAIRGREKVEQAFDLQQETRKLKACFDAHSQP